MILNNMRSLLGTCGMVSALEFFFAYSLDAAQAENIEQPVQANIARIQDEIARFSETIEQDCARNRDRIKQVVVIVGPSGHGKTTLLHLIKGSAFHVNQQNNIAVNEVDEIFDPEKPSRRMKIGYGGVAGTNEPNYYFDVATGTLWYDCPGYEDPEQNNELRNACVLHKLFKVFGSFPICLLFVTSAFELKERSQAFTRTFASFAHSFRHSLDSLAPALRFLVTKNSENIFPSRDSVRECCSQMIEGNNQIPLLSEESRNLMRRLSNLPLSHGQRSSRVETLPFLADQQDGLRRVRSDLSVQSEHMKHFVLGENMKNIYPSLLVSGSGQQYASLLAGKLSQATENTIKDRFIGNIKSYCDRVIRNGNSAQVVRKEFEKLKNLLAPLVATAQDMTFQNFFAHVTALEKEVAPQGQTVHALELSIQALQFLQTLNNHIVLSAAQLGKHFSKIHDLLVGLSTVPAFEHGNGQTVVKGVFLGTSDIALHYAQNNCTHCRVFLSHTLFIDADLNCPSVCCIVIAPLWKVDKIGRTINLSGIHGVDGAHGVGAGGNGSSGSHGHHGGHFYGKNNELINGEYLIIQSIGGNGGRGGNGAQGAQGQPGLDASLSKKSSKSGRIQKDISNAPGPIKKWKQNNADKILKNLSSGTVGYYHVKFDNPGGTGGNGLPGGCAGLGGSAGKAGKITIEPKAPANQVFRDGEKGSNGNHGPGGNGGLGGRGSKGSAFTQVHISKGKTDWNKAEIIETKPYLVNQRAKQGLRGAINTEYIPACKPLDEIAQLTSGNEINQYLQWLNGFNTPDVTSVVIPLHNGD